MARMVKISEILNTVLNAAHSPIDCEPCATTHERDNNVDVEVN
jgi:hypothetical protein